MTYYAALSRRGGTLGQSASSPTHGEAGSDAFPLVFGPHHTTLARDRRLKKTMALYWCSFSIHDSTPRRLHLPLYQRHNASSLPIGNHLFFEGSDLIPGPSRSRAGSLTTGPKVLTRVPCMVSNFRGMPGMRLEERSLVNNQSFVEVRRHNDELEKKGCGGT